jgi:plastocyanin
MKLILFGIAGVMAVGAPFGADAKEQAAKPATSVLSPEISPGASPLVNADQARVVAVSIDNFKFEPAELTVPVGTTVKWTNRDDVPHTATSKDEPRTFDSKSLDTDDSYSFTFTKPGTYSYYCKVHTHMTATIIVK